MPDQYEHTATNPQTGQQVGWDGKQWVPIAAPKPEGAVSRFQKSLRSGMGFPETGTVGGDIKNIGEGLKDIATQPVASGKSLLEGAASAQQQVIDQAYQDQHSPDPLIKARGFIRGLYSALPGLGPILNKASEQFASKDVAGGAGTMTPLALMEAVKTPSVSGAITSTLEKSPIRTVKEALGGSEREIANAQAEAVANAPKVEQENRQSLAQARSDHESELREIEEKYQQKVRDKGQKSAVDEIEYRTKVEQAKQEYAKKLAEHNQEAKQASIAQSGARTREKALRSLQPGGPVWQRLSGMVDQVAEGIPALTKSVKAVYDARWGGWRQAMGNAEGNFTVVQNAVNEAESNILKGSPESIRVFRNILEEGEDPLLANASVFKGGAGIDVKDILGSRFMSEETKNRVLQQLRESGVSDQQTRFAKEGVTRPVDDIRGYAQELENKMYRGGYQGDVYRALKHVRDAADASVDEVVKEKGLTELHGKLKKDWGQFQKDFFDPDGPLTRLRNAANSKQRLNLIAGADGDRIVEALNRYARYEPEGTNARDLTFRTRSLMSQLENMPSSTREVPKAPTRPTLPERPVTAMPPLEAREVPASPSSVPVHLKEAPSFSREQFMRERFNQSVQKFKKFGYDDKTAAIGGLVELFRFGVPYPWAYPILKRMFGAVLDTKAAENWVMRR